MPNAHARAPNQAKFEPFACLRQVRVFLSAKTPVTSELYLHTPPAGGGPKRLQRRRHGLAACSIKIDEGTYMYRCRCRKAGISPAHNSLPHTQLGGAAPGRRRRHQLAFIHLNQCYRPPHNATDALHKHTTRPMCNHTHAPTCAMPSKPAPPPSRAHPSAQPSASRGAAPLPPSRSLTAPPLASFLCAPSLSHAAAQTPSALRLQR